MIDPVSGAGSWPPPGAPPPRSPAFEPVELPADPPEPPPLGAAGPPISSADAIARYVGPPARRADDGGMDTYA